VGAPKGEWRSASQWPLPQAPQTSYALTPKGLVANGGQSAPLKASFTVDYATPCVGEGGGPTMQPCHPKGSGYSLAGKVLAAPVEVTGHALADVWIAADTPDANLFLLLEDVSPDGSVKVVTEGRLKASLRKTGKAPWALPGLPWHRAYAEDAQTLQAGEPVRMQFDLMPTSYVWAKGHRIQISLAGSDYRERARDPKAQPATITLISDAGHPSTISLPIVQP
jgi:putative CocE/NonD family hydrolase